MADNNNNDHIKNNNSNGNNIVNCIPVAIWAWHLQLQLLSIFSCLGFEFWLHSFVAPSWESPFPFPFQLDALTAIAMPQ